MRSLTESVLIAVGNTFRKLCARFGKTLRRVSLRILRNALDRADEWVRAQEIELRQEARKQEVLAEVDPAASRAREHSIKRSGAVRGGLLNGAGEMASIRPRAKALPRLKYQHGEFVRSGAH